MYFHDDDDDEYGVYSPCYFKLSENSNGMGSRDSEIYKPKMKYYGIFGDGKIVHSTSMTSKTCIKRRLCQPTKLIRFRDVINGGYNNQTNADWGYKIISKYSYKKVMNSPKCKDTQNICAVVGCYNNCSVRLRFSLRIFEVKEHYIRKGFDRICNQCYFKDRYITKKEEEKLYSKGI